MVNKSTEIFDPFLHTDNATHRIVESIIMCIIFALGAVCNPVTVSVVIRNKKLHNLHNSLTMNIMLVDSLATFTIVPIQIYVLYMGKWPFSAGICQLTGFLIILFSTCGLWTILWLSILRSLHIYKPAKYSMMVKPRCMLAIITSTWGMALVGCSTLLGLDKIKFKAKFNVCFFMFGSIPETIGFMMPFVVIPLVAISILSVMIFRGLKRRKKSTRLQQQQRQEEKGLAYTYLMLVIIYYVCYFPVFIIEAESVLFKNEELPHTVYMSVTFLGFLPFSIKAIAYMLAKKSTRAAVLGVLKRKNAVASGNNNQLTQMKNLGGSNNTTVVQGENVERLPQKIMWQLSMASIRPPTWIRFIYARSEFISEGLMDYVPFSSCCWTWRQLMTN